MNKINSLHVQLVNIKTVKACQEYFSFKLPNTQWSKRKTKWSKSGTKFSRSYFVRRSSYRLFVGIAVVSISIYLFTVSNWSLLLMPITV